MGSFVYSHAYPSSQDDNVINLIHLGGIILQGNEWDSPEDDAPNAFDGSVYTKWCFTKTSDYPWIAWIFKNGRREISNMYNLSVANDSPQRDPKHWRIYGSNDIMSWDLLDERDNVIWEDRYETKQFVMSNTVEYNAYKFEFVESSYCVYGCYNISEWTL